MKSAKSFKNTLKKPVGLLLILLLLAGAEVYLSTQSEQKLNQQFRQTKQKLDGLVRQVEFLQEQYTLYQKYGTQYQTLVKQGMSQQQDRVKWTDIFLQEPDRYLLNDWMLQYEPQKELKQAELKQLKLTSPIFFQTRVNLKGGAQSDLDIFAILEDISQQISPFYLLDQCKIEGVEKQGEKESVQFKFNPERSNFNFRCALIFFNAKPKKYHSQPQQMAEEEMP